MPIDPKLRERLARIGTFDGSIETPERNAVRILKAADWPTDGTKPVGAEEGSPEWFAADAIWRIGRVRDLIRRVDRREEGATADRLAVEAMNLGTSLWTALYKVGIAPVATTGAKRRQAGTKGNKTKAAEYAMRCDLYLAAWNRARADGLSYCAADERAAEECRVSARTIQKVRPKRKK